jgi:hypothetical protein
MRTILKVSAACLIFVCLLCSLALSSDKNSKCERKTDGVVCDESVEEDRAMKYSSEQREKESFKEDGMFTDSVMQNKTTVYVLTVLYTCWRGR